jgi:rRNA maturation protein Nop10
LVITRTALFCPPNRTSPPDRWMKFRHQFMKLVAEIR